MKVEYLILVDPTDSSINSEKKFIKHIDLYEEIEINKSKISFSAKGSSVTINYYLKLDKTKSNDKNYYYLIIEWEQDNKTDTVLSLLRFLYHTAEEFVSIMAGQQ